MEFLKKSWYLFIFIAIAIILFIVAGSALFNDAGDDDSDISARSIVDNTQDIEATATHEATQQSTQTPTDAPTPTMTQLPTQTPEPTASPATKTITLMDGETIDVPIDAMYCGSKKSEVYHYIDCDSVHDIKKSNFVLYDSKEDAKDRGKRPCKRCNP